ncbi:hypothetical protein INT45_007588 [Circinella minor]|uniref:L-ascorbate oxidase n=1 Tax=Circinella minor TaxID=1195481 RepID=A0A8H7RZQ9_9FUNG|nr:hypothetical protein INT45_007588 [Circinella minor]
MMWIFHYFLLLYILTATSVFARIREIELNLSIGNLNPDCFTQGYDVLMVNGQHPGPPIRVTKDDEVHITVRNHAIDESHASSVHYHGILQIGTPEADGMPNVTQSPIPPGGVFHSNFRVTGQVGTFFYHAHSLLQDQSVHGPFIIYESDHDWPATEDNNDIAVDNKKLHEGPYEYDDERVIFISEWSHQEEQAELDYVMGSNFTGVKDPDSHLINGRTIYDPVSSLAQRQSDDINCEGYSAIDVEPGKVYRLRVIGASTFSALGFSIARHKFTIIEVDGELIQPYETDFLQVGPGQRFSILLKADQEPNESYYINTQAYFSLENQSNALAIVRYNTKNSKKHSIFQSYAWQASIPDMPHLPSPDTLQKQEWLFPQFQPITPVNHDFKSSPDRTVVLMPLEEIMPDGTKRWVINKRPMAHWSPPLLEQLKTMHTNQHMKFNETAIQLNKEGHHDGYDEDHQTFPLKIGEVVDFVIHATVLQDTHICASHPWHTHGMVHYPIANGPGQYNHEQDKDLRTYPTPILRDTSIVYGVQPEEGTAAHVGTPCGWSKIRLFVMNPGVWGFHCHITAHMLQGMMTVLEVSPEQIPNL